MRRGSASESGARGVPSPHGADDDDDAIEDDGRRAGRRALTSATMSVKAFDPFAITVGKHELQVTLVDTPGYGESLDAQESFAVVEQYVDALFERQLRAESSWSPRDAERLRLQDPLVHACLYFIAPHRLKHMDIAFMRALHRKVNIVPIIVKSDTMTTKEKEEFKMQLREALQREGIECYPFDQAVLRAMEAQDKREYKMPWAVIGSTDAYLDGGAAVYLRKYPWGDALSSEPQHSDLPALRNLLMWSGQWHDLKMAARGKYEQWRSQRPLSRRSTTAVRLGAGDRVGRVRHLRCPSAPRVARPVPSPPRRPRASRPACGEPPDGHRRLDGAAAGAGARAGGAAGAREGAPRRHVRASARRRPCADARGSGTRRASRSQEPRTR